MPGVNTDLIRASRHRPGLDEGELPVANATVTATAPSGEELAKTETDENGKFSMTAQQRCDWKIVAVADGHRAECFIAAAEFPDDLPDSAHLHTPPDDVPVNVGDLGEVHRQVIALLRDVDALEQKLRYQDIVGGIGYILGLIGISAYFLAGRRRQQSESSED